MKKYLLAFLPCLVFLLMAHTVLEETPPNPVEDCLDLPDTYFNYANIQLPPYLNTPPLQDANNTPADNPITDAGATLGRVLFYDKKLSASNTQACADCHKQAFGFSDDSALSRGFEGGFTGRNSMGLAHARFYQNGAFFWDERAFSLEDQVLQPIQDPIEMGLSLDQMIIKLEETDYYPGLFADAFGDENITTDRVAKAMAQFIRSMVSYQSKYDMGRMMNFPNPPNAQDFSNFTESENIGKNIFFDPQRGNCASCHRTDAFIAPEARNNGLDLVYEDNGVGEVTGIANQNGLFKVPSLRNIELTFPYMHDGRFDTLEDVIDHYSEGVQAHPNLSPQLRVGGPMSPPRILNLSDEDKTALVDFLKTLTDYQFFTDERWSNPFCVSPVSAGEEDFEVNLAVYPNPASSILNIEINQQLHEEVNMKLLNVAGQLISQHRFSDNRKQLNVQELPAGIYFLHLRAGLNQAVKKIIIE
jgi:cytochrome c peroxidase